MRPDLIYTSMDTPLGTLFVARTEKGICATHIGSNPEHFEQTLRDKFGVFPVRDDESLKSVAESVLRSLGGDEVPFPGPFDPKGTPFQLQVWRFLTLIPPGAVRTYKEVAQGVGRPQAYRAVGNAVASNPIPILVPCHRVVASGGGLGGYALGLEMKKRLLAMEGNLRFAR